MPLDKDDLEIGIIGLGRIGGGIALHAMEKGIRVVAWGRSGVKPELKGAGVQEIKDIAGFRERLAKPRAVFLWVPAGAVVDQTIGRLLESLESGDIIADGGNSYWGDSIRRHAELKHRGIHLVDVGTSGGVEGARHGACFMVGGDREPVSRIEPLLRSLAVEGGYVHAGAPGSGHFTKLVHNGIEFGMLQAIGEGIALVEHYRDKLDVENVLQCWRHGSVIRSWLMDLMARAYRERGGVSETPAFVDDTGEVNWLLADALSMEVPIPIISLATIQLIASRDKNQDWARAIALMRHEFGAHALGLDKAAAKERREGKIGGFVQLD